MTRLFTLWSKITPSWGSIGVPVALTSVAFALGLLVIPFMIETMGQPLPD